MKNKYISKNMKNKFSKSTARIKSVLFLLLGLLLSVTVQSQNCQIIDSAIVKDVSCHAGSDGSIDLVLLNPVGLYAYAWNTTEIIQDIANLPVGVYSVTITDLVDPTCYQDTVYTISQPQDPLFTTINIQDHVKCYGDSTGIASAQNAIGGTTPYTYAWDNGQNTQLAVNLWAATHTVTVTDANGCLFPASVIIENSYQAIVGTINIQSSVDYLPYDISCFGACDAVISLSSTGGVSPYSFNWSTGQLYPSGSGPDTAFNVCYGGHDVLIEDAVGCRKTVTFNITQPDELFANALGNGAPMPGGGPSTQPVQCFGFDDGTAYAIATQGTPGYYYVWDSIQGIADNYNTGQNIDSLTPGVHTVYVTDANGCTTSDTVTITEPTQLVVEIIDSLAIYAYCSNTNSGQLCAVASGGTPDPSGNYNYAWNSTPIQNTACAYNLVARPALYVITVMDDRNCIAQASFDLDSITNSFNEDSVVIIEDSVSCFGLYDGSLDITSVSGGLGGVSPYTYNWNGPGTYTGLGSNIISLYFGNYSLLISDSNGCEITTSIYLNQPDELQYDIYNTVDETCFGAENGQIWVHVNGGTSPYYYDSTLAGTFPIDPLDQIEVINDSLILNLAAGAYSIYITDENNCEGAVTFGAGTGGWQTVIKTLDTIPAPELNLNLNNLFHTTCYNINDGVAEVDSTFLVENPLYTYTWESDDILNPGNPSGVDISNDAGIYWGAFAPGDYWLVAHYADSASFGIPYYGCDNSVSFTILPGTTPIISDSIVLDVSCYSYNDGQIDLNITGGASPYDLYWDTTSVTPNTSNNAIGIVNYILDSLTVGTYAVTIIDADSCITIESYDVTEPLPLISDIIPSHVSCHGLFDGEATVYAVDGSLIPPFPTYLWSDGQTGQTATGLSADTFTVIVTDVQGCSYTDMIVILQPADPVTHIAVVPNYVGIYDVSCYDSTDASAIAYGSGVNFEWFSYDTTNQVIINPMFPVSYDQHTDPILGAGFYVVISEDANACVDTSEILEITEPDSLEFSLFVESNPRDNGSPYHISCFGANDGFIEIMVIGGVEEYNIFWDTTSTLPPIIASIFSFSDPVKADNLPANYSYTVTVIDANGCTKDTTTIVYTEPIEFDANVTTINYAGPFHGPMNISFIDSTESDEPYSFVWTFPNPPLEVSVTGVNQSDNHVFVHEFSETEFDTDYLNSLFGDDSSNVYVMLTNDVTGCQDSVKFLIEVQGIPEVNNVFTPNQDGINDEFLFFEYAMELVDVQIFNRWGQVVYYYKGTQYSDKAFNGIGSDGKDLAEGVYFYIFEGKGVDGHHYDKKGSITLLR
jgi:gliding motility-associated-like protein